MNGAHLKRVQSWERWRPRLFEIRPKAANFFGCRLEASATIESGPRPLNFLDAGWKPALPLALPGFHHAPSLGKGEVAMQARGHGRLDRVGVGCAMGIKLETGETHRSP